MGQSSAGSQMRSRPALVALTLASPHPCLWLLKSTFPYQHLRTERVTPVRHSTHMRMPRQAWITETMKHTPTSPTVVLLLWCPLLVLHRLRSAMFVHEETKLVYHKEMSITTKTAMPRNPNQVSGELSHVDVVRDPSTTQLYSCSVALLCCRERTPITRRRSFLCHRILIYPLH